MTTPHIKAFKVNETLGWTPAAQVLAGSIYGVYVYDANSVTHCCEITPSYDCRLVHSVPGEFHEDEARRENIDEALRQGDAEGPDQQYTHCRGVDKLPVLHDFGEFPGKTSEEALEECVEWGRCNGLGC